MPAFIVLKAATINKQDIKTNSPNKTFLADWKSLMELEIINKKPIPKLHAATTSVKPLTYNNVLAETDGANFSTKRSNKFIRITPNNTSRDPVVFRIVLIFTNWDVFYSLVCLINEMVSSRSKQG